MADTKYRLLLEDGVVGIITCQAEEDGLGDGHLELEEDIKSRVGWKSVRIADALEAWADYLRVADVEGASSRSKACRKALGRLEQGEAGHYAFSREWRVVDEERRMRPLECLLYRDGGIATWQWKDDADWEPPTGLSEPLFTPVRDLSGIRLSFHEDGRHRFGGNPHHQGVTPEGTDTPLHHFLTIDLADLQSPFVYDPSTVRYLSLYYPLAYGRGGPEIQYSIISSDTIRILHMSDWQPDGDDAYVQVAELPEARFDLVPLTYEERRMRAIEQDDRFSGLNPDDLARWEQLGGEYAVELGGPDPYYSVVCRNDDCEAFNSEIELQVLCLVPPIPVNGRTDFWLEYEGAYLDFCFGLCPNCRTVIGFNVCD